MSRQGERSIRKLDRTQAKRVLVYLHDRIGKLDDPRSIGTALVGEHLWRYRVGDYRIIAEIRDEDITVLVIEVGHGATSTADLRYA